MSAPKSKPDSVTLPLKQFLELVDNAGADAPVWALELAFNLDGPKRYED